MATLMQTPQSPSAPLPPDLEPDETWKQTLRMNIEAGLRSMVDEAKQKLNDELAKGIIGPEQRERLTTDHLATLKTIRQLAEEQFRIALERERQERRWASGEQLDQAWSESMMKEQQAILDRIEWERKNKAPGTPQSDATPAPPPPPPLPPLPPPPPPPPPPSQFQPRPDVPPPESPTVTPFPSNRKVERVARMPTQTAEPERDAGPYFSRPLNHERDEPAPSPDDIPSFRSNRKVRAGSITSIGSWKAPSILDSERSFLERSKPATIFDEPEPMARSTRSPTDPPDPTRKESIQRKPSMTARPLVQEFWRPSITPEEDAQMSRTFTLARRSSTASATSSFKAPSILSAALSDPLDAMSANTDRERSSIHSMDLEWTSPDRVRERDRERERPGYVHADDRSVHSGNQRLEDRLGVSLLSATSPSSTMHPRPGDNSRIHVPPPSASRPIVTKRSFTIEETFLPQPISSSRNWNMVSRSPYETRWEGSSRSPQSPEEAGRSWQSSHLRGRFSSQDMRSHYQQEGSYYGPRHVHSHREDLEEDGSDDGFGQRSWRTREYNERRIQDIEEELRKREEAASRREEELARKAEELKREDEARKKVEEQKREEETRRLEEEVRLKEDDEGEREAELRRKEEEASRKEREAAMKEEEARRKEEVAKKKEQEARKKEREARLKEEEAKRREKEARSKELEAKRKEEEVKRKEQEANSREMLARQKEEDARRKEEEVKMMEEEARRRDYEARRRQEEAVRKEEEAILRAEETRKKEEELRKREDELRRREEDLSRREAEMRRREDGRLQDEFRKREEEIRRQRTEDRKKQEVWETWPPETFRPTPPQTPNSSGPWPIPNRHERSAPAATSPPADRVSTSTSGRSNPVSGWSSTSTRPTSSTSTQSSSTPKPTGPATPTPKLSTSSTPNPPLSEAEFHRRQAEQAQQREEQFKREQARIAMQEHERQAKAGKTMSKEEVVKLFEAHRSQWDKIQTSGSLMWEDFPWPTFKRPKGPDDLTSPAITAYMLSTIHPQDRATKERIKDNIRRWHPDRFNSQLLPKVKESERERVSEGAGSVARILNDLLRMHSQDSF